MLIVLTLIITIAGQIGDLAESALKRAAGAKDSGRSFTGHGGFLDIIDSFLFALPVLYGYTLLFHPFSQAPQIFY
jgi:phosphatidate cytidylyltransferase